MHTRGLVGAAVLGVLACGPPKRGRGKPDPTVVSSLPTSGCRSDADCPSGEDERMECFAPDFQPGFGHRGAAEAHKAARDNCSDDSACDPDEQCYSGKGCGAFACEQNPDCPTNFVCQGERCTRRLCSSDRECEGPCVNGLCYATLGSCHPQSYCCPP